MRLEEILAACDHTVLDRCATQKDILEAVEDGIKYSTASVCIPPCFVKRASEYAKGRVAICTVIGFPNGYSSKEAKINEARCAALDGADEIDMVINLGDVKSGNFARIAEEINAIKSAIGDRILKVIIETCMLTDEEKTELCELVSESNADFIKTSTGFAGGGATLHDVELMAKNMTSGKRIKAAGGISSFEDAEAFLNAGASRLGTSRLVKLLKSGTADGY
jgi:deoxyribose-phosphate aldolase